VSDITLDLGPVEGTDVTFDAGPTEGTDITFDVGAPTGGGGGGVPSGAAGGDLAGTYPNPTIGAGKVTNTMLAGSIALSKLATDPLARANHTGTQTLSTISDAGTLAGLNAVASANITDGTIVDADINASAAIAQSKVASLTTDLAAKLDATSGKIGTTLWSTALSITNATTGSTLTDIPGLTFSAVNGVKYRIQAVIWVTSTSSTPDIKIGTSGPTGTLRLQCFGVAGSASSLPTGARIDVALTAIAAATTELGIVANTTTAIVIDGYFLATASGTFSLQAAQMSANATAITIEGNSSLTYYTA